MDKIELKRIKEKTEFIESVLKDIKAGKVNSSDIERALTKCDFIKTEVTNQISAES